jgi:hypothetical protein
MTSPRRKNRKWIFPLFLLLLICFVDLGLFVVWKNIHAVPEVNRQSLVDVEASEELETLRNTTMNFQDLSIFFTKLAEKKGAKYAYDVLRIAPMPPNIDMHLLGHIVGDVLYKQQGVNGIKICTDDFRNACSHSIVVALFLKDGEAAIDTISQVCREAPGGKMAYPMCFHGLGHGVLAYAKYDLEKTIPLCKKAGTPEQGNVEYTECVGGAIMELMGGVHDEKLRKMQATKYFKTEDPLAPCTSNFMPEEVQQICLIYLTPHLFELAGTINNTPLPVHTRTAFTYCNTLGKNESANRDACYGGFGKEFVVLARERDIRDVSLMTNEQLQNISDWCQLADSEDGINSCNSYVLGSLYWGGSNSYTAALNYCGIINNSNNQTVCYHTLIGVIANYSNRTEEDKQFCDELPDVLLNDCTSRLQI